MNRVVLDASAVLAMLLNETGGSRVEALLDAVEAGFDTQVCISSVNWCEILTRMERDKVSMSGEKLAAVLAGVELIPFAREDAEIAVAYARINRAFSLGDRACLALANTSQSTAWTSERLWKRTPLDVSVELIRK